LSHLDNSLVRVEYRWKFGRVHLLDLRLPWSSQFAPLCYKPVGSS
jgi:hypothetical protein